jgi:predicted metal-dependent hydrolase
VKSALLKSPSKLHRVNFGSEVILFSLEFKERKSLAISVHPDLSVSVTAPTDQPLIKISAKVKKRAPWILRQKHYFSKFLPKQPPRKFISGETHKYLGKHYRLKVIKSKKEHVTLKRGLILVSTPNRGDSRAVHSLLSGWYREQAERHFNDSLERCLKLFRKFNLNTPQVKLKKMAKRWGSCTSNGTIYLNPDLIRASKKCLDYVMVHELCHLKIRDHSRAYYRLLKRVMPDWEERKVHLEQTVCN